MITRGYSVLIFLCGAAFAADKTELNTLGVKAYGSGDYEEAVASFTDALKLAPNDQTIAKNLANACRALAARYDKEGNSDKAVSTLRQGMSYLPGEPSIRSDLIAAILNGGSMLLKSKAYARARQTADEALQLDGGNPAANCLAGDIAYALQDLDAARDHWRRALKADPSNAAVISRLGRLGKEQNAERNYSKMEAYHFDIRFDYQTVGNGVYDIRKFLIEAYEKVGQDFDRFPDYPIVVILNKEDEFRMINNVPDYVAGLYDGKIRIPINFTRYPLATIKAILFHEYTHAVVWDLSGQFCPIWLNEGLAMREMNGQSPCSTEPLRQALAKGTILSLDQLTDPSGVWRDPRRAALAYSQSWIMAEYLFSRWSNSDIKNMLLRFKQGGTFKAILGESMNRTTSQFEEEWKAYARGGAF